MAPQISWQATDSFKMAAKPQNRPRRASGALSGPSQRTRPGASKSSSCNLSLLDQLRHRVGHLLGLQRANLWGHLVPNAFEELTLRCPARQMHRSYAEAAASTPLPQCMHCRSLTVQRTVRTTKLLQTSIVPAVAMRKLMHLAACNNVYSTRPCTLRAVVPEASLQRS